MDNKNFICLVFQRKKNIRTHSPLCSKPFLKVKGVSFSSSCVIPPVLFLNLLLKKIPFNLKVKLFLSLNKKTER